LPLPATFRPRRFSRPRRFTPRNPVRVYFAPVTLLGFRLQGLPTPAVRASLEAGALLPFRSPRPAAKREGQPAAPELCSHRSVRTVQGRKPRTAVTLLTLIPLRLSLPPGWDRLFLPRRLRGTRALSPTPPPMPFTLRRGLRSVAHERLWRFLLAEAPAFLGFATSYRAFPCEPVQFSAGLIAGPSSAFRSLNFE